MVVLCRGQCFFDVNCASVRLAVAMWKISSVDSSLMASHGSSHGSHGSNGCHDTRDSFASTVYDDSDDPQLDESTDLRKGLRCHSVCLLVVSLGALAWWLYTVLVINDLVKFPSSFESLHYEMSELAANVVILLFSLYIYRRYIHCMLGEKRSTDCTNFDLYAVLSLLWTLMLCLLSLLDERYRASGCILVRITALIAPGYIHKAYIRYKVLSPIAGHHYLGDISVYKLVLILFYAIHLFSNMIEIPLNDDSFRACMMDLFRLDEDSTDYNLPFIVASVVGRPFLSMLLFHSLVLNVTWFFKPLSYHDVDLFALSFGTDSALNIKVAFLVITLFIVDLLCQDRLSYAIVLLCLFVLISIVLMVYVIYHICGSLHKEAPKTKEPKHVDILEIGESGFVLIGSLVAIILYAMSKVQYGKVKEEYQPAFCELMAWTVFFICQYIFICYVEFNIDTIERGREFLLLSGAVSAVTIMYMFVFEYYHLITLLTDNKEFTVELQIAYSLFWCPIEYLVWSFVTTNHMMHHLSDTHGVPALGGHERVHQGSKVQEDDVHEHHVAAALTKSKKTIEVNWNRRQSTMLFVQPKSQMHLNRMVFSPLRTKNDSDDSDVEKGLFTPSDKASIDVIRCKSTAL